jgi:Tat protein translocase TatB subunit
MFGLGMPEILLILAIALIVIGPKKLPELAKTLGRAMGEFKRSAQDFKRSIDMDTTLQDVKSSTTDLKDVFKASGPKSKSDDTDKPGTGNASEPAGSPDDSDETNDADTLHESETGSPENGAAKESKNG